MKTELVSVKSLANDKFEVITNVNGQPRKDVICRHNDFWVKSLGEYITYFTFETQDFDKIWANSFELRQEISERVEEIVNEGELQTA
jgi:hypothetical protein